MSTRLRCQNAEISFLFTTNREIQKYHKEFMNDPSVTDVITFANIRHSGESRNPVLDPDFRRDDEYINVVISLDQAAKQAKPRGVSLFQEVVLLMAHALLHSKGFDDLTQEKALEMRQKEFELLASVL